MTYGAQEINAQDLPELNRQVSDELRRVQSETEMPQPQAGVIFPQLHVEPLKLKDGLVVLADGTDWNPGSGAGFYGYYGAAWHKLG